MNIIIGFKVIPYELARSIIMNKEECKRLLQLSSSEYRILFNTIYRILSGEKYPDYQEKKEATAPSLHRWEPTAEYRLVNEHKSARDNNNKIAGDSLAERHFFKTGNEPERITPITFDVNYTSKRNF